jgi:succinate dehydrogenase / fumarate reductase, cytochrome b subunit
VQRLYAKGGAINLFRDQIIMAQSSQRPLSPHLTIWRWGPHMLISILHRVTGNGLAIVGAMAMIWWLHALASGPASYQQFQGVATAWYGRVVLIGLSWAFLQHLLSGLRHFIMDMGAGYELKTNRVWSMAVMALSVVMTAALWVWLLVGRAL